MKTNKPANLKTRHSNRIPISLLIAGAAVALYFAGAPASVLGYQRDSLWQAWRFLTCHCVHWNADHLFWSAGTFLTLGMVCERASRARFLTCMGVAALAIPVMLCLCMPDLRTYGGLSGIDSALFVLVIGTVLRERLAAHDRPLAAAAGLMLIAFLGKTTYEFATGMPVFVRPESNMTPVPLAHAAGAIVGIATSLFPSHPRQTALRWASTHVPTVNRNLGAEICRDEPGSKGPQYA